MDTAMLALAFSLAFFFLQGADSTTFVVQNNCSYTVWPAIFQNANLPPLSLTGFELPSGAAPVSVEAPAGWVGRIWARTQCSNDSSGRFSCLTGDCGSGQVTCNGAAGALTATLVEFALQGVAGIDFYDVTLVDGFNLPVSVAPQGGSGACQSSSCPANVNSVCPAELSVKAPDGSVVACKSACAAFNTDQSCCTGAYTSPETCLLTNYAEMFAAQCPQAYSYPFDDARATFTCSGSASYQITFCPARYQSTLCA